MKTPDWLSGSFIEAFFFLGCAVACSSSDTDSEQASAAELTYHEDIAPLVNEKCAGCHYEGGIGGFSLIDPSMASRMAPLMAAVTEARIMPPMPVNNDGSCNTYSNARWLSAEEISIIDRWASAGAPLGDAADAPEARVEELPVLTGQVVTFDLGIDYSPRPTDGNDYHCFVVDPGIATDAFVTGYEVLPDDERVVHHAALFALPDVAAEEQAAALDAAEDGPGYTCFGAPGLNAAQMLGAWAPGTGPTIFPAETGIAYGGGRKMVLQMHYFIPPTGEQFTDRSAVKFQLSTDPGLQRGSFVPVGIGEELALPPGREHVEATGTVPMAALAERLNVPSLRGFKAWGVYPHMHTIGRSLRTTATSPGGAGQCVTDVDRWDFDWQSLWWFDEPVDLSTETSLSVTCGYDTRARSETTVFGEGTQDEMCFTGLYMTLY